MCVGGGGGGGGMGGWGRGVNLKSRPEKDWDI